MRVCLTCLALIASTLGVASQEEHSSLWYAEAQIACLPDATRLCGGVMPDEARVRECMRTKQRLVSAACAAFYPGGSKEREED